MIDGPDTDESAALVPEIPEMVVGLTALLHLLLVIVVLGLIFTGKARLPFGLLGIVVLLLVPVLGPLLVLNWNRMDRKRQHAVRPS